MFFFNLFRHSEPGGHFISSDMHCHVLPGIDDGAPDLQTSVDLILGLERLGVKKITATPHIYQELYPNNRATIEHALMITRNALAEVGSAVVLEAAAEYMLDDHFEHVLKQGDVLTIDSDKVLVEMLAIAPPPQLDNYLFILQTKGYTPIIAHPERYAFMRHNKKQYHDLHERGCILQVNLLSLTGHYGNEIKETAHYLIKNKLVSLLGTDLHHQKHLDLLARYSTDKKFLNWISMVETHTEH
jgi:protein-tyrosine phosphatase